jgi:hypothetical protein
MLWFCKDPSRKDEVTSEDISQDEGAIEQTLGQAP